jgi:uncharacterized protein
MPVSVARVATDSPERYAKQLCEHLSRRSTPEYADGHGVITLTAGRVTLTSEPGVLVLVAESVTDDGLASVCDVAGRHLARFGRRADLVVDWVDEVGVAAAEGAGS